MAGETDKGAYQQGGVENKYVSQYRPCCLRNRCYRTYGSMNQEAFWFGKKERKERRRGINFRKKTILEKTFNRTRYRNVRILSCTWIGYRETKHQGFL